MIRDSSRFVCRIQALDPWKDIHFYHINYKTEEKMARRGGFAGGMPGNMNNLMKQAQRMQRQMEENKKALEEKEFKATAGGGAVEVVMTGAHEMKAITIDPDAVDPDDVETLQDMIIVAVNDVLGQITEESGKLMGGMGMGF